MKYRIIWSAFSENQIDVVFEFYKYSASLDVAVKIVRSIILAPEKLKENPKTGPKEPLLSERKVEYRYIVEGNYKIIYSIDSQNGLIKVADVFDTRHKPSKIKRRK